MPFTPRTGKVEKITYTASAMKPRDIPKRALKGLQLLLLASTTNAAGGATITWESLCKLISKLVLTLNGQDTLINVPFWFLYLLNYYESSKIPNSTITTAAGAGSVQRMPLYLPFELTRAISPEDTTFDGRNLSSITLEAYWGNSVGTNVTSIDTAELDIQTDEYVNVGDKDIVGGARHEFASISYSITGTGKMSFNIPTQGLNQYRRLWIMARDNNGAASDAIFDNLAIRSGAVYYMDTDAGFLKDQNNRAYSISPLTGAYVYDFTRNGKMTERLDARNLSELVLEVNSLVATGSLDVIFEKAIYA